MFYDLLLGIEDYLTHTTSLTFDTLCKDASIMVVFVLNLLIIPLWVKIAKADLAFKEVRAVDCVVVAGISIACAFTLGYPIQAIVCVLLTLLMLLSPDEGGPLGAADLLMPIYIIGVYLNNIVGLLTLLVFVGTFLLSISLYIVLLQLKTAEGWKPFQVVAGLPPFAVTASIMAILWPFIA